MPRISYTPIIYSSRVRRRNQNSFSPLMNEIECFNFPQFGHVLTFYRRKLGTYMHPFGQQRRWKYSMNNKILDPLASYLGHVECYMRHKFALISKDFQMPRSIRPSVQNQQPRKNAQQRNQTKSYVEEKGRTVRKVWYLSLFL